MFCNWIPMKVLNKIEKRIRIFLCNGNNENKKVPLLACDKVCIPKESGDSRLRGCRIMNEALHVKLVWGIYNKPKQ